jgi:hypothetical protein
MSGPFGYQCKCECRRLSTEKGWHEYEVTRDGISIKAKIYRGPNWDKVQEMLGDRVSTKVEYSVDGQHWMPEPPEKTGILYIRETWE